MVGIAVYPGSEAVEDIRMGVCEGGGQIVLCSIKMPGNYLIASLYTNEKGQFVTMPETNGKLLSEVAASGELDACLYIPTTVVMTAENADSSYTFTIVDSETISVKSEKEYAAEGVDIMLDGFHKAYILCGWRTVRYCDGV